MESASSSSINFSVDDRDLDDAELWAVIDSAAASHSVSRPRKPLALKPNVSNLSSSAANLLPSPAPKPFKNPRNVYTSSAEEDFRVSSGGEVLQEHQRPQKLARHGDYRGVCDDENRMVVVKPLQRSPATPVGAGRYTVQEVSPSVEVSPYLEEKGSLSHGLTGWFPSVSLFKQYQNAAMEILEKSDYTLISGNPFIKKSGWRKISCYFNISFEIRDKSIEFDENRNVQRAEFLVRAFMHGGRFVDGWGSCEQREKRFMKPNHDIPSTAETRAKNRACQDLLGIGEYKPGMTSSAHR
ncbi:hypothetical protein QJS10_CPB20g01025 [Acorus calamus]|uniref:Uncharacterized protein n=1 Tax=Acorus calamus TaxID=4465 RepID=A0AAV9CEM6_ACOCL|nr:hypothetical protein QJS10_CPB20g01025 [Acorus calamus]